MVHVRAMLRPPPPPITPPHPNGEADSRRLRVGRAHETAWLFVDEEAPTAECLVYEICELGHFGFASDPVYVGITGDFAARWSAHRQHSWWFDQVDVLCVVVEGFASREEARMREAVLIDRHHPRFNTKQERRHLARSRAFSQPRASFTAELHPRGRPHGS